MEQMQKNPKSFEPHDFHKRNAENLVDPVHLEALQIQ